MGPLVRNLRWKISGQRPFTSRYLNKFEYKPKHHIELSYINYIKDLDNGFIISFSLLPALDNTPSGVISYSRPSFQYSTTPGQLCSRLELKSPCREYKENTRNKGKMSSLLKCHELCSVFPHGDGRDEPIYICIYVCKFIITGQWQVRLGTGSSGVILRQRFAFSSMTFNHSLWRVLLFKLWWDYVDIHIFSNWILLLTIVICCLLFNSFKTTFSWLAKLTHHLLFL
jgi:hypothetical protein